MIFNGREIIIKAIVDGFHSVIPLSNIKDSGLSWVSLGVIITGEKDFDGNNFILLLLLINSYHK
jgi:hypothetical protein